MRKRAQVNNFSRQNTTVTNKARYLSQQKRLRSAILTFSKDGKLEELCKHRAMENLMILTFRRDLVKL